MSAPLMSNGVLKLPLIEHKPGISWVHMPSDVHLSPSGRVPTMNPRGMEIFVTSYIRRRLGGNVLTFDMEHLKRSRERFFFLQNKTQGSFHAHSLSLLVSYYARTALGVCGLRASGDGCLRESLPVLRDWASALLQQPSTETTDSIGLGLAVHREDIALPQVTKTTDGITITMPKGVSVGSKPRTTIEDPDGAAVELALASLIYHFFGTDTHRFNTMLKVPLNIVHDDGTRLEASLPVLLFALGKTRPDLLDRIGNSGMRTYIAAIKSTDAILKKLSLI